MSDWTPNTHMTILRSKLCLSNAKLTVNYFSRCLGDKISLPADFVKAQLCFPHRLPFVDVNFERLLL